MKPLPKLFIDRIKEIYPEKYEDILQAFSFERRGSFRVNTLKSTVTEIENEMQEKWIIIEKFPYIDGVYVFDKKFEYALKWSDAFYSGKIYLQSISSLLPVLVLDPKSGEKILDVCAAPGGKTTQIAMMQKNAWEITALEQNQIRHDKLLYNCRLQWVENVKVEKIDARKFFEKNTEMFDKILLDVPCSAEGRIYTRNEKSFGFWSLENIQKKSALQAELLQGAWKHLKKWGKIVYSTCTLAPEENEEVIANFLKNNSDAEIVSVKLPVNWEKFLQENIAKFGDMDFSILKNRGIRILPTECTEGFFVVKIEKK